MKSWIQNTRCSVFVANRTKYKAGLVFVLVCSMADNETHVHACRRCMQKLLIKYETAWYELAMRAALKTIPSGRLLAKGGGKVDRVGLNVNL